MERSLKRHFREFQTDDERREAERKERDNRYQQSVTDCVRQTSQATDSLHVSDAIQQGMAAAKRKRGDDDEAVITDDEDGAQPNSLITLSGDLVVEESSSGWKVQSQSDFGTMALVLEGQLAKGAQLYYEVHLETAGRQPCSHFNANVAARWKSGRSDSLKGLERKDHPSKVRARIFVV